MTEAERWPRPVGGHVALDFVNTDVVSQADRSTDVLRTAAEFLAWCGYAGLVAGEAGPNGLSRDQSRRLLATAAALRAAVRSVVEAVAEHRDADRDALSTLRSATADAVARAVPVLVEGRIVWSWEPTPDASVWELATAATDLLRGGPTERLKICPGCGFVFLDATKNGSRRWCSMEDCGKQEKMRRYVTKRARRRTDAHATSTSATLET